MIRGIGDELGHAMELPDTFVFLVNPLVQAPTPKVFAAFDLTSDLNAGSSYRRVPSMELDPATVLDISALGQNDLEAAAIRVAPQIEIVLKRLSEIPDRKAIGMSGSGATCFVLFSDLRSAVAAQRLVATEHPEWWVDATKLH
jgi:4-diphosphocytidyl-2-C-methyl-D-erythritol kinase